MPLWLLGGTIHTSPRTLAACSHEEMTVPASYLWSSCMTMMPCTQLLTTSSEDVTANRSPYRMPVPKANRPLPRCASGGFVKCGWLAGLEDDGRVGTDPGRVALVADVRLDEPLTSHVDEGVAQADVRVEDGLAAPVTHDTMSCTCRGSRSWSLMLPIVAAMLRQSLL